MTSARKQRIYRLLKGIETGDPAAVEVISERQYIQHNPQTHEGRAGLAALFQRLSKTSPRVNLVRTFSDGDYVFAHTEYDFATRRIGFEVFRFEGDLAVEHWDNIQPRRGPNASGHSMVDGPTEAIDQTETEANRALVRSFVESVLIPRDTRGLERFISAQYIEHDPASQDGLEALSTKLQQPPDESNNYLQLHRVLADGCFVLAVIEGAKSGVQSAFYELYRVVAGKLVEHWNTIEAVAPPSEWKNDNGKF